MCPTECVGGYQRWSSFKRRNEQRDWWTPGSGGKASRDGGCKYKSEETDKKTEQEGRRDRERERERERQRERQRERETERETETETERQRERQRERERERERGDGKSTEEHSETTWQQGIARRTVQGSPGVLHLPMDRAGESHMQGRHWRAGYRQYPPMDWADEIPLFKKILRSWMPSVPADGQSRRVSHA